MLKLGMELKSWSSASVSLGLTTICAVILRAFSVTLVLGHSGL